MPKNCQKNSMVYQTLIVLLDQVFQADSKALKKLITSYKGSAFKVSWYQQPLLLWQQFQPKFNSFWERQGLSKEMGGTIQEGFRNLSNFWEHLLLEKIVSLGMALESSLSLYPLKVKYDIQILS